MRRLPAVPPTTVPGDKKGAAASRRRLMMGAAASGAALLAGCGMPGSEGAPKAEEKEVTLTYQTDWAGGTRLEWVKTALPKFTDENPKIKVQVDSVGSNAREVSLAHAAAGTLPDVLLAQGDLVYLLQRGGVLQDIGAVLKSLKVKMEDLTYVPSTIQVQGKQYGMPFQFIVWTMVINKTLFRRAGADLPTNRTTYPQLLDALRKVSRPDEGVYGIQTAASAWVWWPYVWGWGGDVVSPDRKRTLLDQPAALEGLQFYVDMMHRHGAATPLDERGRAPQGIDFAQGNVAVASANSPGAGLDKSIGGKFEWDVIYSPLGPRTNKRNVWISDQPNVVTAASAKRGQFEQAVRLVTWAAASKTAQELIVDIGTNSLPTSKAVLNSQKYLQGPPTSIRTVVDMIPDFHDPQIFAGWLEWRDAQTEAMTPAFANKKSVQEAAKDAVRAGDLAIAKNAG